VGKLRRAAEELESAMDEDDIDALRRVVAVLRRVLDRQPLKINRALVDLAKGLQLEDLRRAMERVHAWMAGELTAQGTAAADLAAQLERVEMAVVALESMGSELAVHVADHDTLQDLDNELRMLEVDLAESEHAQQQIGASFGDLRELMRRIRRRPHYRWFDGFERSAERVEQTLKTEDPERLRSDFRRYRSKATKGFQNVDLGLLELCGRMNHVGAPLGELLEVA
jgi:chromosome segregation ATPase